MKALEPDNTIKWHMNQKICDLVSGSEYKRLRDQKGISGLISTFSDSLLCCMKMASLT